MSHDQVDDPLHRQRSSMPRQMQPADAIHAAASMIVRNDMS
jgi:hypothetical protein